MLNDQKALLRDYYEDKIIEVMLDASQFILQFLGLVRDYDNLYREHLSKMQQGIEKLPESLKQNAAKIHSFRKQFSETWESKKRKTTKILGYIFEVHMTNLLIIFRNYKLEREKEANTFLIKFRDEYQYYKKDQVSD